MQCRKRVHAAVSDLNSCNVSGEVPLSMSFPKTEYPLKKARGGLKSWYHCITVYLSAVIYEETLKVGLSAMEYFPSQSMGAT